MQRHKVASTPMDRTEYLKHIGSKYIITGTFSNMVDTMFCLQNNHLANKHLYNFSPPPKHQSYNKLGHMGVNIIVPISSKSH